MKRLRIILDSKIFLILLFIISLFRLLTINNNLKSIYNLEDNEFICTVINISNNKLVLDCGEILESNKIDNIKIGNIIKIKGSLSEYKEYKNINMFSYKEYQKNKNIFYKIYISSYKILDNSNKLILNIRSFIYERIKNLNSYTYLKSFILGDKNDIDDTELDNYKTLGIIHLFAISGMHMSLLVDILNKLLKTKRKDYILVIFLFIYYKLIESISLLRCIIFYLVKIINSKLKLNYKEEKIIIISLFVIFIINPYSIYNIGFYYSFIISSGIILFNKRLINIKNKFNKTLIMTIFIFLISIPINIYQNYEINILTILYNLIFIPFISFIIFPLSILTTIFPVLDSLLRLILDLMINLSFILKDINIILVFRKINIIYIVIYYLLLAISIYNYKIIYIFIIILTIHYNINYLLNEKYVLFLDIGQGDSTLIYMNNKAILIDTGGLPKSNYSLSKNITIKVLKSLGIKKINILIISHGDYDHMGEAINLVDNFKVEKVIFNCGSYNDLENELIKVLDKKKINYYSCIKELNIDDNILYFLQTKEYDNENDNSNVIYTELDGYKFMFMGDASIITEKEILDKYNLSNIDVLKVGHHGSKTSSSKEFIDDINPKYSVISVGKKNRYGHPNKEVLDVLSNSKIYRTDEDGSIMFKIKNNKLKIETCEP